MWGRFTPSWFFEVGQGAGDAQDAVVAAGGEFERVDGFREQRQAGFVGACDGFQELAVGFGVRADGVACVALALDVACGGDARPLLRRCLRRAAGALGLVR